MAAGRLGCEFEEDACELGVAKAMGGGFVSYAQNFEDHAMRALSHVDCGFYIDIGAHHPTIDSVSLAFYERGWTGIDVEPVPDCAALLREHRLRTKWSKWHSPITLQTFSDSGA